MKKIIKIFVTVLLCLVVGALVFRVCVSCDRSVFDDLVVSDASRNAYGAAGELTVYTVGKVEATRGNGYFSLYSLFYIPETGELQVTVKYNTSAYDYTDASEDFEFRIYNETENEYYEAASSETAEKWGIYRYEKLTFAGVDIKEGSLAHVTMNTAGGEVDRLTFHYEGEPFDLYRLSRRERKALETE